MKVDRFSSMEEILIQFFCHELTYFHRRRQVRKHAECVFV